MAEVAAAARAAVPRLAALDVDYRADGSARAAVLAFDGWEVGVASVARVVRVDRAAAYEPGAFYQRELPCLLAAIDALEARPEVLLVDGHAWLRATDDPGLGAHLWRALASLGWSTAVVGVGKSAFAGGVARPVRRGASMRPLWVSAVGIDVEAACAGVARMHGEHRIPTLLAAVDRLARTAA